MRRAKFMVSFEAIRKALNLPDNCKVIAVKDLEPNVFLDEHIYVYVEGPELPICEPGMQCEEITPSFTSKTVIIDEFQKWNVSDEELWGTDWSNTLRRRR